MRENPHSLDPTSSGQVLYQRMFWKWKSSTNTNGCDFLQSMLFAPLVLCPLLWASSTVGLNSRMNDKEAHTEQASKTSCGVCACLTERGKAKSPGRCFTQSKACWWNPFSLLFSPLIVSSHARVICPLVFQPKTVLLLCRDAGLSSVAPGFQRRQLSVIRYIPNFIVLNELGGRFAAFCTSGQLIIILVT